MTCCCCAIQEQFNTAYVRRELTGFRKKGPAKTTRLLLESLISQGVSDATLLDIGGGFGAIQRHLFPAGLREATLVEASPAYVEAATDLAAEGGYGERVTNIVADFAELGDAVPHADLVTLDKVICCYPDMPTLVNQSAVKARRLYGFVVPRDWWPVRLAILLQNILRAVRGNPFRTFVYSNRALEDRVRRAGFERVWETRTFVWKVAVYQRAFDPPAIRL